jgi:uncharacterized membrane protein YphA (DoxX/SURF4 family)
MTFNSPVVFISFITVGKLAAEPDTQNLIFGISLLTLGTALVFGIFTRYVSLLMFILTIFIFIVKIILATQYISKPELTEFLLIGLLFIPDFLIGLLYFLIFKYGPGLGTFDNLFFTPKK